MAAPAATGIAYYDPKKIIGSMPQVDDSVATQVTNLAAKDSNLNQMAATEGLKAANRRGLLNSSMAVGAAQDAVLQNVLPIAQQDAAQRFQKNQQQRAFEQGLIGQENQQNWQTRENVAARGWQTAENVAQRGFIKTQADLDRTLQQTLQSKQIKSAEAMQLKAIAAEQGLAAAQNALQKFLQANDIEFRMSEGGLNRAAAVAAQQADIAFQRGESALTRDLQEQIAQWNLKSTDKANAAQFLTNMETMYQSSYQSIMANTALNAETRTKLLSAAKNLRNNQLNFVEQMYNVDLKW